MRLSPGKLVYGVSPELLMLCALQLRWRKGILTSSICEYLGASINDVGPIISAFIKDGFLVAIGDGKYTATERMSQLAVANISNGITRKEAEQLLEGVIQRAVEINSGKRVCDSGVAKLVVFGSFLDESKELLGDLDIGFEYGKDFKNTNAKRVPKLRSVLRGSNTDISIHYMGEIEEGGWPFKVVFDGEM